MPVELGAQAHQLAYPGRALGDQHLDGGRVAQPDAGDQRVGGVRGGRVHRVEHGGDAALGPPGRAVVDVDLGDDRHVQTGLAQVQRGGQAGDAGADHDDVGRLGPAGAGPSSREGTVGSSARSREADMPLVKHAVSAGVGRSPDP